jgi:KTSC domain
MVAPRAIPRLLAIGLAAIRTGYEEDAEDLEEINLPVSSTAIRSIGWRGDGVITVEFIRGGTYSYEGTKEMFLAFASAPSKGAFFNEHFR